MGNRIEHLRTALRAANLYESNPTQENWQTFDKLWNLLSEDEVETKLKVKLVRSTIGHPKDQKATVASLGLKRLQQVVVVPNNSAVRGMVFKVRHLVVSEVIYYERITSLGAAD